MNIKNLSYLSYWLQQPLAARGVLLGLFVGAFLWFILFGLVAKIARVYKAEKWEKDYFGRIGNFGLTMGLLGLIWLFFRQEQVAFFAWRFWLLFWLVGAAFWTYRLIWFYIVRIPKIKSELSARHQQSKYLP